MTQDEGMWVFTISGIIVFAAGFTLMMIGTFFTDDGEGEGW